MVIIKLAKINDLLEESYKFFNIFTFKIVYNRFSATFVRLFYI